MGFKVKRKFPKFFTAVCFHSGCPEIASPQAQTTGDMQHSKAKRVRFQDN
jgi:hypothetical protein